MNRRTQQLWILAACTVLVTGVMALFFTLYDPWQPVGPERIRDGGFEGTLHPTEWTGWNDLVQRTPDGGFQGSGGVVLHTAGNRNGILRRTVGNPAGIPAFRASLRAKVKGVVRGRLGYHIPRALFYYRDMQGKGLWSVSHGIVNLRTDSDWKLYSDVFPVPDDVLDAHIHIENGGFAGVLQIDDVSLIPVRPRPSAPWWRLTFATLWMSTFGLCLFTLRPWRTHSGLAATVLALVILAGIVMPGDALDDGIRRAKSAASGWAATVTPAPPAEKSKPAETEAAPDSASRVSSRATPAPQTPEQEMDRAHETGHRLLFGLLGIFAALCWLEPSRPGHRALWISAGLFCFAAATETLQMITPDREAAWSDLMVDMSGAIPAVTAVLIWQILRMAYRRRRR